MLSLTPWCSVTMVTSMRCSPKGLASAYTGVLQSCMRLNLTLALTCFLTHSSLYHAILFGVFFHLSWSLSLSLSLSPSFAFLFFTHVLFCFLLSCFLTFTTSIFTCFAFLLICLLHHFSSVSLTPYCCLFAPFSPLLLITVSLFSISPVPLLPLSHALIRWTLLIAWNARMKEGEEWEVVACFDRN